MARSAPAGLLIQGYIVQLLDVQNLTLDAGQKVQVVWKHGNDKGKSHASLVKDDGSATPSLELHLQRPKGPHPLLLLFLHRTFPNHTTELLDMVALDLWTADPFQGRLGVCSSKGIIFAMDFLVQQAHAQTRHQVHSLPCTEVTRTRLPERHPSSVPVRQDTEVVALEKQIRAERLLVRSLTLEVQRWKAAAWEGQLDGCIDRPSSQSNAPSPGWSSRASGAGPSPSNSPTNLKRFLEVDTAVDNQGRSPLRHSLVARSPFARHLLHNCSPSTADASVWFVHRCCPPSHSAPWNGAKLELQSFDLHSADHPRAKGPKDAALIQRSPQFPFRFWAECSMLCQWFHRVRVCAFVAQVPPDPVRCWVDSLHPVSASGRLQKSSPRSLL
eukprot:GGOE01023075.1.p1 GENE.GGOE01023075.1~~GGOE01023075.1.p1  ORF type:complete len:385 (+),score=58.73 GGOE01023075.1:64-1218(+)